MFNIYHSLFFVVYTNISNIFTVFRYGYKIQTKVRIFRASCFQNSASLTDVVRLKQVHLLLCAVIYTDL